MLYFYSVSTRKCDSEPESASSGNMEESDFEEFSKIWKTYEEGHKLDR